MIVTIIAIYSFIVREFKRHKQVPDQELLTVEVSKIASSQANRALSLNDLTNKISKLATTNTTLVHQPSATSTKSVHTQTSDNVTTCTSSTSPIIFCETSNSDSNLVSYRDIKNLRYRNSLIIEDKDKSYSSNKDDLSTLRGNLNEYNTNSFKDKDTCSSPSTQSTTSIASCYKTIKYKRINEDSSSNSEKQILDEIDEIGADNDNENNNEEDEDNLMTDEEEFYNNVISTKAGTFQLKRNSSTSQSSSLNSSSIILYDEYRSKRHSLRSQSSTASDIITDTPNSVISNRRLSEESCRMSNRRLNYKSRRYGYRASLSKRRRTTGRYCKKLFQIYVYCVPPSPFQLFYFFSIKFLSYF